MAEQDLNLVQISSPLLSSRQFSCKWQWGVRRKQGSPMAPREKAGRIPGEREALRGQQDGHQHSLEPHFIFLQTILHAAAVVAPEGLWFGWLGTG